MWYSSLVPSLLDPPLLVAKYGTKSWGGASLEYSVHSLRAEVKINYVENPRIVVM